MALLTQAVTAETSFPQIMQQQTARLDRQRMQDEAKAEKAKMDRSRVAKEQGVVTAGIQGLQAYPSLYGVAQRLYDDYNAADESGNVEEAEQIKGQLMKFTDAAAGFSRSEITTFNDITTDPKKMGMYNNSIEEIAGVLESNKMKRYEVKREGNSYTLVDASGNSFGLFDTPEMRGVSFVGGLDQRASVPNYVTAMSFGESNARTILGRGDVTDKTGKITNPDLAKSILRDKLGFKLTSTDGQFLNGIIYDYQKANGEMDKYDNEAVERLKADPKFVEMVKKEYIENSYQTVDAYENVQKPTQTSESNSDKLLKRVNAVPVTGGDADFTEYGQQVKFMTPGGGLTVVNKMTPEAGGISTIQSVMIDKNGNITTDQDAAVGYSEKTVSITPGTEEWNRLSNSFGGEDYLIKLMRRIDPAFMKM